MITNASRSAFTNARRWLVLIPGSARSNCARCSCHRVLPNRAPTQRKVYRSSFGCGVQGSSPRQNNVTSTHRSGSCPVGLCVPRMFSTASASVGHRGSRDATSGFMMVMTLPSRLTTAPVTGPAQSTRAQNPCPWKRPDNGLNIGCTRSSCRYLQLDMIGRSSVRSAASLRRRSDRPWSAPRALSWARECPASSGRLRIRRQPKCPYAYPPFVRPLHGDVPSYEGKAPRKFRPLKASGPRID